MKNDPLHFRMRPEERAALERACQNEDRTLSALVRRYVRDRLRRDGYLPAPEPAPGVR